MESTQEDSKAWEEVEVKMSSAKRLLIVTVGTRGDIQPYIALAIAMQEAGWEVGIVTSEGLGPFVAERTSDISFFPLHGNPAVLLNSPQFIKAFYEGRVRDQIKMILAETKQWEEPNFHRTWEAAKQFRPTLLLSGFPTLSNTLAAGQKLRVPVVSACTLPIYPTSEWGPVTAMTKPLPLGFLNSFAYWATYNVLGYLLGPDMKKFRGSLNLCPKRSYLLDSAPQLCLYSERVVPRPHDWPEDLIHITGNWDMKPDADYEPSQELEAFLQDGEAPVYMGFGSMPLKDAMELAMDYAHVLAKLNRRGILQLGWSPDTREVAEALSRHPHVLLLPDVPHDWLFPRCSLVIHHGGAGTTAAAFKAGIPSLIFPVLLDQPFWASRVAALGVGPQLAIPLKELTRENLESQILACSGEEMVARAREFGARLRADGNGVDKAVHWLEQYAASPLHPLNRAGSREPPTEDGFFAWLPDTAAPACMACDAPFSLFTRRQHCRICGAIFCGRCVTSQRGLLNYSKSEALPVCHACNPYPSSSSSTFSQ